MARGNLSGAGTVNGPANATSGRVRTIGHRMRGMELHALSRPGGASGKRGGRRSGSDVMLAVVVIAVVAMMILPMPTFILDALVAVNIALGVMLVLMGIYIQKALQFSAFPSVLLIGTLFRLSLSVATTRMILLEGDAGAIIDTFGGLVAGGNLVVGLVVFLIITLVQFLVIAKGAERVAEVGARFTLDAMPGKQMSIDSDLRSGLIDKTEARATSGASSNSRASCTARWTGR